MKFHVFFSISLCFDHRHLTSSSFLFFMVVKPTQELRESFRFKFYLRITQIYMVMFFPSSVCHSVFFMNDEFPAQSFFTF